MAFSWVTSSAIEFTSNGVKVMGDLSKAAKVLAADMKVLQANVDAVMGTIDAFAASSIRATEAVTDLSAAIGKSNTATTRAATRATRAAAAYDAMGASAARAAQTVSAISARGGGGGSRGGGAGFLGMLPGPLGIAGRIGGVANALTGGGLGHLLEGGTAIDAMIEAGRYQANLQSIANITGATRAQMPGVDAQMYDVAHLAAMSPVQASGMFREEARMSQGSMSLSAMQQLLPLLAKAQVVIGQTRGYSPEQTTDAMMSYVHLMRLYDPKKMGAGFDLATRFFELIPNAPAQAIKQLSYFVPQLKTLGVSDAQQDALMITLARAGYGQGKGGTGLANAVMQSLGPLQVTSFAQAQKAGLLQHLGMTDQKGLSNFFNDRAGGNVFGMLDELTKFKEHAGNLQAVKTFQSVFGIQGARIISLLTDPIVHANLQQAEKAMTGQKSLGLDEQFSTFRRMFSQEEKGAWNDFQALMTELGGITLPGATKALHDLGGAFHDAQAWLHQHKDLEKQWADDIMNTVKGVEGYLTAHQADFKAIGKLAMDVGHWMGVLGTALGNLLGPLTSVAGVVAKLADVLVGAPVTKQQVAAHEKLQQALNSGAVGAPGTGAWNTPSSRSAKDSANDLSNRALHIEQHFDFSGSSGDPKQIAAAAKAGTSAAIAAAQKARTHGALFTLPNTANLSLFGPSVVGAH